MFNFIEYLSTISLLLVGEMASAQKSDTQIVINQNYPLTCHFQGQFQCPVIL